MKTLVIKVKDSVYDKVKSFLEIMPKDSIEIIENIDFSHIDFVSEKEQIEIEKILKNEDTKEFSKIKTVSF